MFLNVKNLSKSYGTDETIIKKLNFSIEKGEIISFIGESGSGKTTFLKCLAGLENIDSGLIELNGRLLNCLLYTSPSPRDNTTSRMPSSA